MCQSRFTGDNIRAFLGSVDRAPIWVASVHQVRQNSGRAPRPKLGDQLDVLFFVVVAVIVLAILISRTKQKPTNASNSAKKPAKQTSGLLGFQETGTSPKTDSAGRVIVKLKGGSPGLSLGVNRSHLELELANKLAGKVNDDGEFSKSIKVRIRPDTNSQFENSVLVETTNEKFIGWILKDASADAVSVMDQIVEALVKAVPDLFGKLFTFEVSAKIEGAWDEVGEGEKEEWEADIELMEIKIKAPAEIEID